MMNKIYKHLLAASLLMTGGTAMAQTLNSAYFTDRVSSSMFQY